MIDINDKEKLRKEYSWLSGYGLSDQTLEELNTLIVRATIGSDSLDIFFTKLKALLPSDYDESELKSVASLIAVNSFVPAKDTIDRLDVWASELGIELPESSSDDDSEETENYKEITRNEIQKESDEASQPNASSENIEPNTQSNFLNNSIESPGAHMAFSMSDEKEIQSIKIPDSGERVDWVSQAKAIITQFGLRDLDSVIVKRLENIIIAKLKDVRDDLETSDALTRPRKVGGMEFNNTQADQLLSLIKNWDFSRAVKDEKIPIPVSKPKQPVASPKIEMENGLPVVRLPDDLMVKPELMDEEELEEELIFQQLKENISNVRINEKKDVQEVVIESEIKKEKEKVLEVSKLGDERVASVPMPQIVPPPTIAPKPEPFLTSKRLPPTYSVKNPSKPNLDGIKVTKSVMGPIDELEAMTLIEFRRLSSDPFQATKKIKEDIETLSKEGFDRRSEAIAAWHRSEVSKFYRLLGHVAMSEGKSVESVIGERLVSGKPTLSMNEFEAIMELNKLIRF